VVHALLDRLAAHFAEGAGRAEIAAAREDYFTRSGKVFEDDGDLFESRLASFLEWYVVERPLAGGPPPALQALADDRLGPGARAPLGWIAASHRSVFDIAAVAGHTVELEDILGGARFSVVERRSTVGFQVGDLVEARLVWDGQEVVFTKTFLFHPQEAREPVIELVDGLLAKGVSREEIMFTLARVHVRWHRLGTGAARVYREALVR
jgi:hypothetical protein